MYTRSKSTLFLIEQLIVVAVFAISAAACITILASAYFTTVETHDLKNAILAAESVAETFKATDGSLESMTVVLGATYSLSTVVNGDNFVTTIYYDSKWQMCAQSDASYLLRLVHSNAERNIEFSVLTAYLSVYKIDGDELNDIISFPVALKPLGGGF